MKTYNQFLHTPFSEEIAPPEPQEEDPGIKSKEKRRREKEERTGQKQRREEGVTSKKLEEVRRWKRAQIDFVQVINRLLLHVVKQSISMGILASPNQLALCVDGTLYNSMFKFSPEAAFKGSQPIV